ncbi:MAG: metal-sensing transcriptional repressor [Clostridiales bacterium]|nr:metal-sensing transcriptional repressor [Clostridiales bacterium]
MEDTQKKNTSHKHVHSHLDCNGEEYTHDHEHGHSHSPEHKKAVFNRMSRIIGHMESTRRMVESERDCAEILIQLSAIEAAINSVSRVIIKEHLKTCIVDAVNHGDYDALDELNNAIDKFIK